MTRASVSPIEGGQVHPHAKSELKTLIISFIYITCKTPGTICQKDLTLSNTSGLDELCNEDRAEDCQY